MISEDYVPAHPPVEICKICHNNYEVGVSCAAAISQKLVNSCNKYLHSAIIDNNLNATHNFNSSDVNTLVICPQCFRSVLRLTELNDQLEDLQKCIHDFLLSFSLTVLHRRTKIKTGLPCENKSVEIDISKFPGLISEAALSDSGGDPLLINFSEEACRSKIPNNNMNAADQLSTESMCTEAEILGTENTNDCLNERDEFVLVSGGSPYHNKTYPNKFEPVFPSDTPKQLKRYQIPKLANALTFRLQSDACFPQKSSHGKPRRESQTFVDSSSGPSVSVNSEDNASYSEDVKPELEFETITTYVPAFSSIGFEAEADSIPNTTPSNPQFPGHNKFQCSLATCGKYFTTMGNLQRHMRLHSGERPFSCSICGKRFSRKSHYEGHVRCVHTNERPYKCSYCSKAFTVKPHLIKHIQTHKF